MEARDERVWLSRDVFDFTLNLHPFLHLSLHITRPYKHKPRAASAQWYASTLDRSFQKSDDQELTT